MSEFPSFVCERLIAGGLRRHRAPRGGLAGLRAQKRTVYASVGQQRVCCETVSAKICEITSAHVRHVDQVLRGSCVMLLLYNVCVASVREVTARVYHCRSRRET